VIVRRIEEVASRRLAAKFSDDNDSGHDRPRGGTDPEPTVEPTDSLLTRTPPLTTLDEVQLLDTTLRDGEQMPGVSLTPAEKVDIARELDAGMHLIEAGSACTSEGEREAIRRVADEGLDATVTSFARGVKADIDHALDCGVDGINLVVPASDKHVETKVGSTRDDVVDTTVELVEYATDHGLWVEVLGEDGSRADLDYLERLLGAGLDAGADRICYCDTVGAADPERTAEVVSRLADRGPTSLHTHDDLVSAWRTSTRAEGGRRHRPRDGHGRRRARRQRRVGGGRDRARPVVRYRHRRAGTTLPSLPDRFGGDRGRAPAEQGGLRRQRLRPRIRDPYRRDPERRNDVRVPA